MVVWTPPPAAVPTIVPQSVGWVPAASFQPSPPPPDFRVLYATPIDSNTVRVYLSREPKAINALSADDDVLLRSNWNLSLVSGPFTATIPIVERVFNVQAQPNLVVPGFGAVPTAWSVDLDVDRRLEVKVTYLVIGATSIASADGLDVLATDPFDRDDFPGIIVPRPRRPQRPRRSSTGIDFRYETFEGRYVLDPKTDIDIHGGVAALRKRIIRRVISSPAGFHHLPDYGVGLRVKELLRSTGVGQLQNRVRAQVVQEPEVREADVEVSQLAADTFLVTIRARIGASDVLNIELTVPEDGPIVVG